MLYPRLKELIEQECGIRAYGYVPVLQDCSLESRHLGLVTASEVADLQVKLNKIATTFEETIDIDGLLELAGTAPELSYEENALNPPSLEHAPRIAVAHDDAFCFYYSDTLRTMERLGAELVSFSPLSDAHLPEGASGLYLGGGYPELHCPELSGNTALLAEIREAAEAGMPIIAECGGFMFLHEELEDAEGRFWPMVGVIPGRSFKTPRLSRFGYIDIEAKADNLLCGAGDSLPAHEFHYWESSEPGAGFHAQKPQSGREWDCVISTPTLYAGFPHLYLGGCSRAAKRFVDACAAYDAMRGTGAGHDARVAYGATRGTGAADGATRGACATDGTARGAC
jgi:cobyrinic acid a,c-diamide synthase